MSLNKLKDNFGKIIQIVTNLMLLTILTNFLKGCELVKRVLCLGMEGVIDSIAGK